MIDSAIHSVVKHLTTTFTTDFGGRIYGEVTAGVYRDSTTGAFVTIDKLAMPLMVVGLASERFGQYTFGGDDSQVAHMIGFMVGVYTSREPVRTSSTTADAWNVEKLASRVAMHLGSEPITMYRRDTDAQIGETEGYYPENISADRTQGNYGSDRVLLWRYREITFDLEIRRIVGATYIDS